MRVRQGSTRDLCGDGDAFCLDRIDAKILLLHPSFARCYCWGNQVQDLSVLRITGLVNPQLT